MKVKAIGTKVILVAQKKEEKSEGGIILSETQKNESNQGVVISVGDKVVSDIKVGDRVLFDTSGRAPHSWLDDDGERQACLDEMEIIAVFEK